MNYAPAVLPLTQAEEGVSPCVPSWHAVGFDLRLLESFVALASELHFGRAAEKLAFAQPALSQQIRRLEAQPGSALFIRDTRRVELTATGTAFLPYARESLADSVGPLPATLWLERRGDRLTRVKISDYQGAGVDD